MTIATTDSDDVPLSAFRLGFEPGYVEGVIDHVIQHRNEARWDCMKGRFDDTEERTLPEDTIQSRWSLGTLGIIKGPGRRDTGG